MEIKIGFFGAFYQEGNIQLALEYMEGGSLSDIIKTVQGPIQEKFLSRIIQQVMLGLRYLHKERHLIHRDLKVRTRINMTGNIHWMIISARKHFV